MLCLSGERRKVQLHRDCSDCVGPWRVHGANALVRVRAAHMCMKEPTDATCAGLHVALVVRAMKELKLL